MEAPPFWVEISNCRSDPPTKIRVRNRGALKLYSVQGTLCRESRSQLSIRLCFNKGSIHSSIIVTRILILQVVLCAEVASPSLCLLTKTGKGIDLLLVVTLTTISLSSRMIGHANRTTIALRVYANACLILFIRINKGIALFPFISTTNCCQLFIWKLESK